MKTESLVACVADLADCPPKTAAGKISTLQGKNLISKGTRGRYGGVEMVESDGVNALLAVVLNHPRGECVAASVARIRALPLSLAKYNPLVDASLEDGVRAAFQFTRGLSIRPVTTLGDVLDGLVADMRSGAFDAWAAEQTPDMVIDFHDAGRNVVLIIDRWQSNNSVVFGFDGPPGKPTCTERIVRIRRPAFQGLANALGPLPTAIPPPYYPRKDPP
jgi:hypothetical protein